MVLAAWVLRSLSRLAGTPTAQLQPWAVRVWLERWGSDLGQELQENSRGAVCVVALSEAGAEAIEEMNAWLAGRWSTRESLAEILWRLEVSPHAISAADWLWEIGDSDPNHESM